MLLLEPGWFRPIFDWAIVKDKLLRISFVRLLLAVGFYFAAPATRMPMVTLVFAAVFLLSAISIPLVGERTIRKLVGWWIDRIEYLALPWSLIAIALGVFFMWLAWPVAL